MGLSNWFRRKRPATHSVKATNMDAGSKNISFQQEPKSQSLEAEQPLSDFYMLPKDAQELHRLDFQHYLLRSALKSNYLAPISQPTHILDVACGTGRWVLEMATTFPLARVTGIDLTPPTTEATVAFPSNCNFQRVDVIKGLPFSSQSLDFVHQRFLVLALPLIHWPTVLHELVRVTSLGGWVELVEVDLMFNNRGQATERLLNWIAVASQQRGIDISIGQKIEPFLKHTNLANVTMKKISLPLGDWGGRLGNMLITDFHAATHTLMPLVIAKNGITEEDYKHIVDAWMRECEEYHTTCDFYIAYGQKLM
jgi:ubiquinone/menaquinone biosynthesis C-methylase UbiE